MQLIEMMTLAGGPKDEQPGRQREAGLAKKRSHKPGTVSAESCVAQEQRGGSRAPTRDVNSTRLRRHSFGIERRSARSTQATLRIESPFRRITVSRSGSHFQKYRVE